MKMCWTAVVACAYQSGAIDEAAHNALSGISGLSYGNFVDLNDTVVGNVATMATVPPGSLIGIFELNTQQVDHVTNTTLFNQNVLTHAMIATGNVMRQVPRIIVVSAASGHVEMNGQTWIYRTACDGFQQPTASMRASWVPQARVQGNSTIERFEK